MADVEKPHTEHLQAVVSPPDFHDGDLADEKDVAVRGQRTAGEAIIEQQTAIPLTGERIPTTKLEYILFSIFCEWTCDLTENCHDVAVILRELQGSKQTSASSSTR